MQKLNDCERKLHRTFPLLRNHYQSIARDFPPCVVTVFTGHVIRRLQDARTASVNHCHMSQACYRHISKLPHQRLSRSTKHFGQPRAYRWTGPTLQLRRCHCRLLPASARWQGLLTRFKPNTQPDDKFTHTRTGKHDCSDPLFASPRTRTGYVDGVVVQRQCSRRRVAARLASLPGRRPRDQPRSQVPTRTRTLVHVRPRRQTRRAGQSPTKHAEGTHHDDKCAPANGNDTRLRQRQNNRRHGTTKTATMLRTRPNAFSTAQ